MSSYNGWTNYETWAVNLWMSESADYWESIVDDVVRQEGVEDVQDLTYKISKVLKEQHEETMPETIGVYADLLSASLREVNWYEIAEHLVDDAVEQYKEEIEE